MPFCYKQLLAAEGGKEDTITMTGVEFVRRFTLHLVPPRFRRVRYAGLLGQGKRTYRPLF